MKPTIKLKSPLGTTYICKWRGDSRSKSKSLGRYKRPGIKGEVIQDMDIGAVDHSMSIYIDGKNFARNAQKFWKSCDENGLWTIDHPVKGTLKRQQLISVTENINLVDEGGYVKFDLAFVESIDGRLTLFTQSFSALVASLRSSLRTTTISAFSDVARIRSSRDRIELTDSAEFAISSATVNLSTITRSSDTLNSTVNTNLLILDSAISSPSYTVSDYATSLFDYIDSTAIETVTTVSTDGVVSTSDNEISPIIILNSYTAFINDISDNAPPADAQGGGINTAITNELIIVAGLCAMCQSIVTSNIKTQSQALTLCDLLYDLFYTVRETLDGYQLLFDDNFLEYRYFSQTETYYDVAKLITNTCKYLREQSFSLKKEKRFTLKESIDTIVLVIEEYGELGENQENYDLFIDSNNLYGTEILRLPAGKQVLIYA